MIREISTLNRLNLSIISLLTPFCVFFLSIRGFLKASFALILSFGFICKNACKYSFMLADNPDIAPSSEKHQNSHYLADSILEWKFVIRVKSGLGLSSRVDRISPASRLYNIMPQDHISDL